MGEYDIGENKKNMDKNLKKFTEEGRKSIKESIKTVFTLNKNAERHVKQLEIMNDLKSLRQLKVENELNQRQKELNKQHKNELQGIENRFKEKLEVKNLEMKAYLK